MKQFTDAYGNKYDIDINLDVIEKVKEVCQVDLTALFDKESGMLGQMVQNPRIVANILTVVCQVQDNPAPLIRGLKGDALEAATLALLNELIDFFPNARMRAVYRQIVETTWAGITTAADLAQTKLAEIDLKAEISRSFASATSSAGSSGSTPAP